MKHEFKLKKAGYYKAVIKQFIFISIFLLTFAAIMCGVFYFTGLKFNKPFNWKTDAFPIFMLFSIFLFQFIKGWRQARNNHKSYKVSFDSDSILIEQGFWDGFSISSPTKSQRRLYYREITEIRKSNTGYYTLKGEENSYPNTLIISADVENIHTLEEVLSEIKPIRLHHEISHLKEYPLDKKIVKINHWQQIITLKSLSIIFGGYFLALLLAYFWFNPINWSLTQFLSILYFSLWFILIPIVIKNYNKVLSITVDKTAVIVERAKGNPVAMPFNEITTIRKKDFQFFITGKKISTSFPNFISFPTFVKDSNTLEQKLSTIQPIVYK